MTTEVDPLQQSNSIDGAELESISNQLQSPRQQLLQHFLTQQSKIEDSAIGGTLTDALASAMDQVRFTFLCGDSDSVVCSVFGELCARLLVDSETSNRECV